MKKRDVLAEVHKKTLSEEQAEDVLSNILDSRSAAEVKSLLCLSSEEWTAKAQGADWVDVASWRYLGWPERCSKCGKSLRFKEFGWRVVYRQNAISLEHLKCP